MPNLTPSFPLQIYRPPSGEIYDCEVAAAPVPLVAPTMAEVWTPGQAVYNLSIVRGCGFVARRAIFGFDVGSTESRVNQVRDSQGVHVDEYSLGLMRPKQVAQLLDQPVTFKNGLYRVDIPNQPVTDGTKMHPDLFK